MELREKIELIMNEAGYSSSAFADYIGLSRPKISHILAGRNNPSWEVLESIIKKFPELGTRWILEEEEIDLKLLVKKEEESFSDLPLFNQIPDTNSRIKKIVVFYTDNTFTEFISR